MPIESGGRHEHLDSRIHRRVERAHECGHQAGAFKPFEGEKPTCHHPQHTHTGEQFINFAPPEYGHALNGAVQNRATIKTAESVIGKGASDSSRLPASRSDLAQASPAVAKPLQFDATKSISEQVKAGTIKDGSQNISETNYLKLESGKAPKIQVAYENKDSAKNGEQAKPNFTIDKNGVITMLHNPEGKPADANIVVQVQRDAGQTGSPPPEQQKAIDALVGYLGNVAQRVGEQNGAKLPEVQTVNGTVKQITIDDPQGLVSDTVQHQFGDKLPPSEKVPSAGKETPDVPSDVADTSDRMERTKGSGGNSTIPRESAPGRQAGDRDTPAGADDMVPPREVPQGPKESNKMAATKDMLAALSGAHHDHPYDEIRKSPGSGYHLGRYGMNHGMSMAGLAQMLGIDLGDPPDYSKLQAYLAAHPDAMQKALNESADKLDQDAKDKHLPADDKSHQTANNLRNFGKNFQDDGFRKDFSKFLDDIKGNGGEITKERLNKFMPKEFQETLADGALRSFAKQMNIDPDKITPENAGKLALSAFLGRPAKESDLQDPDYKRYANQAADTFKWTEQRLQNTGDIVTDSQGNAVALAEKLRGQQLWRQFDHGASGANLGCASALTAYLRKRGFSYAASENVWGLRNQLLSHGWHYSNGPVPGGVVIGDSGGRHAHIGAVGENGYTYANSSGTGQWTKQAPGFWNGWRRHYWLVPPGETASA